LSATEGSVWTFMNYGHKKRRPWTSLDVEVVGRGDLNLRCISLINRDNTGFKI
jgi:hypothetical protein